MVVDKTFSKSMDGGFGRSTQYKKGKSIMRIIVFFFLWKKWSKVVNLPPGRWLVGLAGPQPALSRVDGYKIIILF